MGNNPCDCMASGNRNKPKQHGADPHAKNCAVYRTDMREVTTLDTFTRHYLLAALWTTDPNPGPGEWSEHDEYTIENIAPESIDKAAKECRRFREQFAVLLYAAGDDEQNGHDFWLTRNRHGIGFWDRGYGTTGELLTEGAHGYGGTDLYMGDDGRLYLT